jgi:beta-lactamase class A
MASGQIYTRDDDGEFDRDCLDIPMRRDFFYATRQAWLVLIPAPAIAQFPAKARLSPRPSALPVAGDGRLGVAVLDTATGRRSASRVAMNAPLASTFRNRFLAAAVLASEVDQGRELDRRVPIGAADLVDHAPV